MLIFALPSTLEVMVWMWFSGSKSEHALERLPKRRSSIQTQKRKGCSFCIRFKWNLSPLARANNWKFSSFFHSCHLCTRNDVSVPHVYKIVRTSTMEIIRSIGNTPFKRHWANQNRLVVWRVWMLDWVPRNANHVVPLHFQKFFNRFPLRRRLIRKDKFEVRNEINICTVHMNI